MSSARSTAIPSPARQSAHAAHAALIQGLSEGVFAIAGPAGAGKSHIASALAVECGATLYSIDCRFIGDSAERRLLLERKQLRSLHDYQDSVNQFNWWDWAAIQRDLDDLARGRGVVIEAPYDRTTGMRLGPLSLMPAPMVLVEGALLGPPDLVGRFCKILFLCAPARVRFERILDKDGSRRSFNEILARFLVTEYSEALYYRNLFDWAANKLAFLDSIEGRPCSPPSLAGDLFLPMRIKWDRIAP